MQSHIDQENRIEYLFAGFDKELSLAEMLAIIKRHGKPRRNGGDPIVVKKAGFSFTITPDFEWEHQMFIKRDEKQIEAVEVERPSK